MQSHIFYQIKLQICFANIFAALKTVFSRNLCYCFSIARSKTAFCDFLPRHGLGKSPHFIKNSIDFLFIRQNKTNFYVAFLDQMTSDNILYGVRNLALSLLNVLSNDRQMREIRQRTFVTCRPSLILKLSLFSDATSVLKLTRN